MFWKKNKNHWTKSRNPDSKRYKLDMAEHLHGMSLKCVTERVNGIEEIIGKGGSITFRNGEIIVYSSMDTVFRCVTYKINTEAGNNRKSDFKFKLSIKNSKTVSDPRGAESRFKPG